MNKFKIGDIVSFKKDEVLLTPLYKILQVELMNKYKALTIENVFNSSVVLKECNAKILWPEHVFEIIENQFPMEIKLLLE